MILAWVSEWLKGRRGKKLLVILVGWVNEGETEAERGGLGVSIMGRCGRAKKQEGQADCTQHPLPESAALTEL